MAAVATRASNNPAPHLSSSRMSSPKDNKKIKTEETSRKDVQSSTSPKIAAASSDAVQPPEQPASDVDSKPITKNGNTKEPLGPPPKPSDGGAPDYFSGAHGTNIPQYVAEPNPFEAQFGNPSSETPGKSLLPPVSSLTSPQPLVGTTPGWPSLRSGPLSPAMLTGPSGPQDYFDQSFSRGFPTPNESGLRTGLTPGGGGSMFPAPSPNSQALFNSLQSGGATPSTLDFYRTSLGAKAAAQSSNYNAPTSQPTDPQLLNSMDRSQQSNQQDSFGQQHADADAVNGLYMLAQANPNGHRNGQFTMPAQQGQASAPPTQNAGPTAGESSAKRNSKNSITSPDTNGSDAEESEPAKPATRSRGKRTASTTKVANSRRKAEETPAKPPAAKRAKATAAMLDMEMEMSDEEDEASPTHDANGKKMTDEEKRKNFLERNRVAALKCRQRKKQWLANLQAKVELFSTENDALSQTVTQLREELVNLKSLLLAHKDCPVSVQQGIAGPAMAMYLGADAGNHHSNPYGIGLQNGMPGGMSVSMAQQAGGAGLQRR